MMLRYGADDMKPATNFPPSSFSTCVSFIIHVHFNEISFLFFLLLGYIYGSANERFLSPQFEKPHRYPVNKKIYDVNASLRQVKIKRRRQSTHACRKLYKTVLF